MNRLSLIFTITILAGISTLLYLASPVDAVTSKLGRELRSSEYADLAVDNASTTPPGGLEGYGLRIQKGTVGIGFTGTNVPLAKFAVNNPETVGKTGSTGDAIYAYSSSASNAAVSVEQGNSSGYALYSSGGKNYFGNKVRIRDPYWSSAFQSPTSTVDAWDSLSMHIGTVTGPNPDYAIPDSSFTTLVDTTAGGVVLSLPSAASIFGRIYTVKRITAGGYSVVLATEGNAMIDGANTLSLSAINNLVMVQSDGSNWNVISKNF